jgi:hypothetical protein
MTDIFSERKVYGVDNVIYRIDMCFETFFYNFQLIDDALYEEVRLLEHIFKKCALLI